MVNRDASRRMAVIVSVALVLGIVFLFSHIWLVWITGLNPWELAAMSVLIGCELFVTLHGAAYFANVIRVNRREARLGSAAADTPPPLREFPPVAFAMCSYREPLSVLEENMVCFRNLTYRAKRLYLLDDTRYDRGDPEELAAYRAAVDRLCERIGINVFRRHWHGAKAGIINDFLEFLADQPKEGFEFTNHQGILNPRDAKYLAVFDADMNPLPDFAEPLVARLESDERLAFIQTPQFYSNTTTNRVANGSALQQAVFYEYICDGKGLQESMPCCGTNVMFRVAALQAVGGMDETSVTEDFATSIKLHLSGWRSAYLNRVCAFGMGPQDLAAFFKQQFRWASGTVGLLQLVLTSFLRNPRALPAAKWLEYLASVSYYCVGWVWVIIWCFPLLFVFFGFPRSLARPEVFFALFLPYVFFTYWAFFGSLRNRGYTAGDVFAGLTMNIISFPVFMKASLLGLLGVKGSFGVTPKEGASALPLLRLWPQLLAVTLAVLAVVWGLNLMIYGVMPVMAVVGNIFWCAYNAVMIGMVLYFNNPEGPIGVFERRVARRTAA